MQQDKLLEMFSVNELENREEFSQLGILCCGPEPVEDCEEASPVELICP